MYKYLIETLLGIISGLFLGITGIAPTGLILIILDYLNIGEYKSTLGAILFLNLFPITLGSVWEFYKAKQIDFKIGFILLMSVFFGSYFGSQLVVGEKYNLSEKTLKYITSGLGFFIGIIYLISAIYSK